MSDQPTLFEPSLSPNAGTLNAIVRGILFRGGWVTPYEICDKVLQFHNLRISDASATARIRDLRKAKFGAYKIEKRRREGSRAYEYAIVG